MARKVQWKFQIRSKHMLEIHNPESHLIEYSTLYNEKKYIEILDKFLAEESQLESNPNILNIIGASHQQLNNMELAKEYFEKSSELNPNDPQIVYNLANLEYRDKSYQKAFDLYHKALNNNLSSPLVLVQMGRCLMGLGSLEDAAILFDNALESDPKCEQAYIEHAEIMALKNDPEATIDYFYKALDINPSSPLALQRLARYFNKINRPKVALNFAQKAINLGIADKYTFYEQALVLYKIGYPEEAIFSLKKILEVDSKDSEAFNLIGKCLIKLKMFDEAVESFCDAIYFKSDIQEYYTNLGLSLSELGRFNDAQECLTKAISLSEDSSNANYLLGKIYSKSGNAKAALEQYTIAGNLNRHDVLPIIGKFDVSGNNSKLNPITLFKEVSSHLTGHMPSVDSNKERLELESVKINTGSEDQHIVIRSFGNSQGALYFHSLLDGHPDVYSLPGYYLKTWFEEETWSIFIPDYTNNNWRQVLANDICRHFEPMFDASSKKAVLGITEYTKPSSTKMGLDKLGQEGSEVFNVDPKVFKDKLLKLLLPMDFINQNNCFELVHEAFEESYRNPSTIYGVKNSIVYNLDNASSYAELNFFSHYPDSKVVSVIQNPLVVLERFVKDTASQLHGNNRQSDLDTLSNLVSDITKVLLSINDPKNKALGIRGIKLEDLVKNTDKVMPKIATSLGIKNVAQIYTTTCFSYNFLKDQENQANLTSSLDTYGNDGCNNSLNSKDRKVFETLFWPMMSSYKYTNVSKAKFQKQLAQIRPWLDKPLQFEKELYSKIDIGDLKLEESDSYQTLHKHLIIAWDILATKGVYPYPLEPMID